MPRPGPITGGGPSGNGGASGRLDGSHRGLRTAAIGAAALTFALIAVGGLVRATGSGEGCTGWPKCLPGHWLPPLEYHALIEYSHRMTAFLDICVVAILAVVAWRRYREVPRVVRPATSAVVLIVAQAVLGAIVVKGALAPLLVTAHFATAMILVAVLVYATVASYTIRARPRGDVDGLTALARAVAIGTFGLLLVGAYVRGENAGLVFADWPLMNGRAVPSITSVPAALQFTHRVLAVVIAVGVAWLVLRAWRERSVAGGAAALALLAAALFVVQVLLGAALVWTAKAVPAVVAHVTVSSLVWGALVATAAAARAAPRAPVARSVQGDIVRGVATPA
jgi:heme a synthase